MQHLNKGESGRQTKGSQAALNSKSQSIHMIQIVQPNKQVVENAH